MVNKGGSKFEIRNLKVIRVPGNQVGIDSYREAGYQGTRISGKAEDRKYVNLIP